uniref:Transposase (Putative), gypsy type n=1 Tax=Tanacetum cinerariifolium TaxID=118510 RepID=A0A6L2KRJ5_TANCI|nr:hypothetical protein [Tanacetum cinerariifolium]
MLHPELPEPEDRIVDFPEGKVGVYTKFFEFANFCLPLLQFLFDVLGYYQIHLSQLSVIGAAKVSHFEINCLVLNIIPTLSLIRMFYTPSFNSGWMSFSKRPEKNTPQCYTKPLDSLKNWNNRFFWVDERVFPTVVDWRTNALKDEMPTESTYSVEAVRALDTHRTHIQKQPEMLLCLVGISRRYYLRDEVYPAFLHDDDRDMDLFNLIRAPNPTKVKIRSCPRTAHKVPLLTLTANRLVEMDDLTEATDSSGVPSIIERSPLDFAHEAGTSDQGTMALKMPSPEDVPATDAHRAGQAEEVAATDPSATESRKRGRDGADVNAPLKVLRRDHADPRPTGSAHGGKSLAAIELGLASTRPVPVPENAPTGVSDPDPLSFADPQSRHPSDIAQSSQGTAAAGDPDSENASSPITVGFSESIYRPEWGVANGSLLDTPEACQDLAKLLRKSVAQVACRDKKIQARELEIKNLEALLETEADIKKAAEDKSAGLNQELKDMRARFSDLQMSNERLSQQVATLQEQVSGEEKLKAAFEEFKQYEDNRVETEAGVADVVSVGIAKGMSEGLRHGALKDLKYSLVDQLEGLKDAPTDVIMAALYLESDTGDDAQQYIRDLHPSFSQLTIPVYPEVRGPRNPWAYKEEMLLVDAIVANISTAEKKKKCRIVCCTHGVGSAHHARSDGVPVSVTTVVP